MKRFKNRNANFTDPKQIKLGCSRVLGDQADAWLIAGLRKYLRQLFNVRSMRRVAIDANC
jgi:hypothetical protein